MTNIVKIPRNVLPSKASKRDNNIQVAVDKSMIEVSKFEKCFCLFSVLASPE